MAKRSHSLGFQALNQARSATHASQFLAGHAGLVGSGATFSKAFHAYGAFFSAARKAMREMAIINAASVLDKQSRSTGMYSLINQVSKQRPDLAPLCSELIGQLDAHRTTFEKATKIRSNIIAHRSNQLTFRRVYEDADLTDAELREAIDVWISAAQQLAQATYGKRWHPKTDVSDAVGRLMRDIAAYT